MSLRQKFLGFAAACTILALLRLVMLATTSDSLTTRPRPRSVTEQRIFRLQPVGAEGDTLRLFFPEVPLSLEQPYSAGPQTLKLALTMDRAPETVICHVLSKGKVIAESGPRRLTSSQEIDLGRVELHPVR